MNPRPVRAFLFLLLILFASACGGGSDSSSPAPLVARPTFTPVAGTYQGAQTVEILCATEGAAIYYTLDGTVPDTGSALYAGPIAIPVTTTVRAIGVKAGMRNSDAARATFVIIRVEDPVFSPVGGTYESVQNVALSTATPGALIHYTTDGSVPIRSSSLYTGPIPVASSLTLKAIGVKDGMPDSKVAAATYVINLPKAATPVFSPSASTFASAQTVQMSSATAGAVIRYTLDGSQPLESSAAYSAPLSIQVTTTVKAVAFKDGMPPSETATGVYIITKVPAPTFTPAAGTYGAAQSVAIGCALPGAEVRYTLDSSIPGPSSLLYSAPIAIGSTAIVKAVAFMAGFTASDVSTAAYTVAQAEPPVFTPPAGVYGAVQEVSLSSATAGAAIYYTTDGTTPTADSSWYTGPVPVTVSMTIKAVAIAEGLTSSPVSAAVYTLSLPKVAAPTFNPVASTYTTGKEVEILCATADALIHYTLNGATPTAASPLYVGPISVTRTTTVRAIALKEGMADSNVSTAVYTINLPQAAAPAFTPAGGSFDAPAAVGMVSATEGASIHYTLDGTAPTVDSPLYAGGLEIITSGTVKAIAAKEGMEPSDVASAEFAIDPPPGYIYIEPVSGLEFVWVPAGVFQMGAEDGDGNEAPVHEVSLTKGFWLGRFEMTQFMWKVFMGGGNPSFNQGGVDTDLYPVEQVSWDEVNAFIEVVKLSTGRSFALPTEAQWERAARGDAASLYAGTDLPAELPGYAWYADNSEGHTNPVGMLAPNPFGLYDMSGNVWEWVKDWHALYGPDSLIDPAGPPDGATKSVRGGGFTGAAFDLRSSRRSEYLPWDFAADLGFRLVLER